MGNTRCSGALLQGKHGEDGHFEMVTPSPSGHGFIHYNRDNDKENQPWGGPCCYGARPIHGLSLVESNFGPSNRNLALAANEEGELAFYFRADTGYRWHGPTIISRDLRGTPSLIQSTLGRRGNFEVVAPLSAGLVHFYRDNDDPNRQWYGPYHIDAGEFQGAAVIQSDFGSGNLEVVAQRGDQLVFYWREGVTSWQGPRVIAASGIGGAPVLIRGTYGNRGNFEVVVPLADGGLAHYWRNNDDRDLPWECSGTFGKGRLTHLGLVHSTQGRLEVIARDGDRLVHFWRQGQAAQWVGPLPVGIEYEYPVAECVYGWTSAYLQDWVHVLVRVQLEPEPGVEEAEVEALKPVWQDGIHRVWNRQCACRTATGDTRNLTFEVQWVAENPHHHVLVRRGPVRSNLDEWGTNASGEVAAHEFGHMLGLVDEYEDILCPGRAPVNTGTIMDTLKGRVAERHAQRLCMHLCTQVPVRMAP